MAIGFFKKSISKLKEALGKTRGFLGEGLKRLFSGKIDEEALEEMEALFVRADLGVDLALELTDRARHILRNEPSAPLERVVSEVRQMLLELLRTHSPALVKAAEGPTVHLIVGVNGNGKTTSVAKLAKRFLEKGESVLLGAADTFRAAAADQLALWAERIGVPVIKHQPGSDPSAVVYDTLTAALARGINNVLIDTAGRLHTKGDLLQELAKIARVCHKLVPGSPHEVLLVLDATTGQNALEQAKVFKTYTPVSGLILTKLDGTAKGGMVVAVQKQLGIPVKFIGVGEGSDDLRPFDPEEFVDALFD